MCALNESSVVNLIFYQLLILSFFLYLLSFFKLIPFFHYEILVVLVAFLGVFVLRERQKFHLSSWFILFPFAIIILVHSIPLLRFSLPLGFDAGIYKYLFEHSGVLHGYAEARGLYVLGDILQIFLRSDYLLTWVLIFLALLTGLFVFLNGKKYFGQEAGFFSLVMYAVSSVQLKAFHFLYYKQLFALLLILFILYYLEYPLIVILVGSYLAGVHTPTFLIFMISYFLFSLRHIKTHLPCFAAICVLGSPFYFSNPALLQPLQQIEQIGGGNFLSLTAYFILSTSLFFAFLGVFQVLRKKEFGLLLFLTIVTSVIVLFRLFFYYRYLISLDLFLTLFSGFGIFLLLQHHKKLGTFILLGFLGLSFFSVFHEAFLATPEITEETFQEILTLPLGTILTERVYAPWILGYRGDVIAPLLFGDTHTKQEWNAFFNGDNETLLLVYHPDLVYVDQDLPYSCLRKEQYYYVSSC